MAFEDQRFCKYQETRHSEMLDESDSQSFGGHHASRPRSNGPGRARLLLDTITIEMFGPVGPEIGPTGPNISIGIVSGPDSAEPGLLLLLR